MLQTLTFNGARVINAEASFFRYESASAGGSDDSVKVRADGQELGVFYPGDSVELPDRRAMWELTPAVPTLAGTVRLGVGRVQSARLVGVVQVVDTAKSTTVAGVAYSGSISAAPAGGFYGTSQLWNPAGSGRRLVVEAAYLNAGATAISATFGVVNAAQGASGGTIPNHLSGGAASVGLMYSKADHAADPNSLMVNGTLWGVFASSNSQPIWTPKRPVVLMPGFGLLCACRTVAVSHSSQFDFYEEAL